MNPAANGECGPWQQPAFGQALSAAPINPAILEGWGVRPSDWQFGASVQHEILPRTSVEVGYHRRWFQGFLVTDNLASTPADYAQYTFTAPTACVASRRWRLQRHVAQPAHELLGGHQLHDVRQRLRRPVPGTGTAWTST